VEDAVFHLPLHSGIGGLRDIIPAADEPVFRDAVLWEKRGEAVIGGKGGGGEEREE